MNQYEPDYVIAPGKVLEYELDTRKMTKAELAKRTGITEKHLIAIIKGTGTSIITPETAIKLERALGVPVQYWLNLEANYQAAKARADEQRQLEKDLGWLQRIPVAAMVKMGWLPAHKEKSQQLGEVLRFFGIASVEQWEEVWPNVAVAYRQHNTHETHPEAVSVWLRKGELVAAGIECQPFDKAAFRQALDTVCTLTAKTDPADFIPELQALCAAAGVAVVFVPALPKTGVSGATRWINPDKAIIQLSLRYKTNDHLWFTFFHEAGHILLHGKKELFLEGNSGLDDEKETQANEFAEQELLPRKLFNAFKTRNLFSKAAIQAFAKEAGIAPGIVVGQLQHKGLLQKDYCNDVKISYQWQENSTRLDAIATEIRGDKMILENKFGITDQVELARAEEKISKQKAKQLFESGKIHQIEVGTYNGLALIHQFLFEDMYTFAGKIREVNIAKGTTAFARVMHLEASLKHIDAMPQGNFDEIIEKYVEMNMAHPFREGNGRATRIWLDLILKKEIHRVIDWNKVNKDDYLSAMERSVVKDLEIKALLRQALTDQVDDRALFMKGIDVSYYYEGYSEFRIEDL